MDIARWLQEIKEILSSVLNQNNILNQNVAKLQSELECVEKRLERVEEELA